MIKKPDCWRIYYVYDSDCKIIDHYSWKLLDLSDEASIIHEIRDKLMTISMLFNKFFYLLMFI